MDYQTLRKIDRRPELTYCEIYKIYKENGLDEHGFLWVQGIPLRRSYRSDPFGQPGPICFYEEKETGTQIFYNPDGIEIY